MSGQLRTSLAAVCFCLAVPMAAQGQPVELPDGAGKQAVEATCIGCHALNMVQRSSGYTHEEWQELILTMVDLSGRPELATISGYLATHFPPNTKRSPTLISGDASITFQRWVVPTLGQRSRDPIQAQDGSIWWNGQWGDLVGRIDPETGEMQEFPLPAGSRPHSITFDNDGNLWYTGNGNGTVGMLDRHTGEITVYPMPDPAARDPHTAIFDRNGTMWFTLQNSNMLGRLIPATGDIKLVTMPTEDSKPYGIRLDSQGVPWVACNGSNCLVSIDPETMEITEYLLPQSETTVRRLDIADDDTIWYVNSSLGYLGHFDPKTGEVKEWPSPSGRDSHPYALAIVDGIIWYNESGKRPDALVRFDPVTEEFQSWPIPSGGVYAGIIRHMRATREGDLLIHQSSTNHIILVGLGSND